MNLSLVLTWYFGHVYIASYSYPGRPSFEPKPGNNPIASVVLRLTPHYQRNDKEYTATQKDNATDKVPDITRSYSRDDEETGADNEENPTGKTKSMLHTPTNILYTQ